MTYPVIVELFVRDVAASRAFYEALGFRATNEWPKGAWMEREGVGIRLELDDHVAAVGITPAGRRPIRRQRGWPPRAGCSGTIPVAGRAAIG